MSLIGLDVGTTGCKAIIFDPAGRILSQASREYSILTPRANWAEQDAEQVWALAWESLKEAIAKNAGDPPKALALSVQGEAVIPVDAEGRALRHAILGMDTRTGDENRWLVERFGDQTLFARTGMPVHTINTLPKLLWLQRHEPQVWKAARQFLLYEDFFLRRLGGRATISHCLASRTQMYDLSAGGWATDILDTCGIDPSRLAPLAAPDAEVIGSLRRDLADELGLQGEVLLAGGGHDQACAALGSGVIRDGLAMVSTGTAEVVEVAMQTPKLAAALREGGISVYRHVVPRLYVAMTLNHSGGLLLRWFRDTFCQAEIEEARRTGRDAYDLLLGGSPQGPTDLMVLPHLVGSGTPTLDTSSRGAILGLSFATNRSTLAKAILEGLTFELRVNLDLLRDCGIAIDELRAVGGGARSRLWLGLKADICGVPLRVPRVTEAACLGAAMLAGVACGVYRDIETAVNSTVRLDQHVVPDSQSLTAYAARFETYRQLYPALKNLRICGT
ncbi:MAG TPA: FGGY family carbohydrate kinase [Sedimentisphaerales bacterium]|nr:FGGY family carbohydrate kinase [Sedimentisphaerales bacterium]HQI27538.1 FGGY family carbohydrate kinase [Sedimentisphaerales bacterium]